MQQFHTFSHKEFNMKRVETCMHNKCVGLYGTVEIIPKNVERAEGHYSLWFQIVRSLLLMAWRVCILLKPRLNNQTFSSNNVLQFATLNARGNWADLKSSGIVTGEAPFSFNGCN